MVAILLAGARAWAPATDLPRAVLRWTYPAGASYPEGATVRFNVRCWKSDRLERPNYDWPIITNLPATAGQENYSVALPIDTRRGCVWFALTAVDTNGIESDFAR